MRNRATLSALAAVGLGIGAATAQSQPPVATDVKAKIPEPAGLGGYRVLPPPEAPFRGTIGRTVKDSTLARSGIAALVIDSFGSSTAPDGTRIQSRRAVRMGHGKLCHPWGVVLWWDRVSEETCNG